MKFISDKRWQKKLVKGYKALQMMEKSKYHPPILSKPLESLAEYLIASLVRIKLSIKRKAYIKFHYFFYFIVILVP